MQFIPVAEFSERAEAEEAAAVLKEAGIISFVGENGQYTISVPEDEAYAAIQLLAKTGDDEQSLQFEAPQYQTCPECGSFETSKVSDVPQTVIGLGSIAVAAILYINDQPGFAFAAVVIGLITGSIADRHSGKYRCSRCGWLFLPR